MIKMRSFPKKDFELSALILDLRGTLIDPIEDYEITDNILLNLHDINKEIPIAIITAGSLETVTKLFLNKWQRTNSLNNQDVFIYTDTAAKGFRLIENNIVRLPGFYNLIFSDNALKLIQSIIFEICNKYLFKHSIKIKEGQINFYVNKPFNERLAIANEIRSIVNQCNINSPIHINVPSTKNTIDICLSSKARGAQDYIRRLQLVPKSVIFISDSLQRGASDTDILNAFPNCFSIHVGDNRKYVQAKYCTKGAFVDGTFEILQFLNADKYP